jgi:hypothetical protein
MTPTLEATQTGAETFEVAVRPDNGVPVTLYVVPLLVPGGRRWYVKRTPDPQSLGYITRHTSFELAAKAATGRAKRYLASYARTMKRKEAAA